MRVKIQGKQAVEASLKGVEDRVREAVISSKAHWRSRLLKHPEGFERIEREVHQMFRGLADELVAGLLDDVTETETFGDQAKN